MNLQNVNCSHDWIYIPHYALPLNRAQKPAQVHTSALPTSNLQSLFSVSSALLNTEDTQK